MEHLFFPNSGQDQKEKGLHQKCEHLFSPNSSGDLRSDARQSLIIGGNTVKLLGGYIPIIPPDFGTPVHCLRQTLLCQKASLPKEPRNHQQ